MLPYPERRLSIQKVSGQCCSLSALTQQELVQIKNADTHACKHSSFLSICSQESCLMKSCLRAICSPGMIPESRLRGSQLPADCNLELAISSFLRELFSTFWETGGSFQLYGQKVNVNATVTFEKRGWFNDLLSC